MNVRRTWPTPRPTGRGRADHTAIVGCDLFIGGVAVESPGPDLRKVRLLSRHRRPADRDPACPS